MEREEKIWLGILAVVFVMVNVITLSLMVPWQSWMVWSRPRPEKSFHITYQDYTIHFPPEGIQIEAGENTQWVIMTHAHTLLLMGLGTLLFGVIYALLPMLTGKPVFSRTLALLHFWLWIGGAFIMTYSMGVAGTHGMLRRTLYPEGSLYQPQLNWAMIGGITLGIGSLIFIVNLLLSTGKDTLVKLIHDPQAPA